MLFCKPTQAITQFFKVWPKTKHHPTQPTPASVRLSVPTHPHATRPNQTQLYDALGNIKLYIITFRSMAIVDPADAELGDRAPYRTVVWACVEPAPESRCGL